MRNWFRLLAAAGLGAFAILAIAAGLIKDKAALLAPANLALLLVGLALYLLPTLLAVHRNCIATGWIAAINVLLGWTLFGWVIALGWAAGGKQMVLPPAPPVHPIPGH